MKSKLVAYAMDFASFLIQKTKYRDEIGEIILFGSVSRGEESKESDVDVFISVVDEKREVEKDIRKCLDDFNKSAKYNNYWRMLDVKNEIVLTIGNLDRWKELKPSIISNGITLYGKYMPAIIEGVHNVIFVWENIKPNSKRVLFNKQLFGFKQGKKAYQGLIHKYSGDRLGKGCIIVPLKNSNIFHQLFKKYKITVKIKKFLEY